jgi:transcriptional regulator with XRE-family HTH domain
MEEREISQKEFANRTGISQSTISDWKRKGTNPSADKIMIICEVLSISPYELLSGTENNKMKEYKELDYVIVDKQSTEFEVLETYRNLDMNSKRRLEGYMKALTEMECNK